MILPSKHLTQDRALLTVGSRLLRRLDRPASLSSLWDALSNGRPKGTPPLGFDRFVLTLDLLFMLGAIKFVGGLIRRTSP